ncbi:MAG: hypothetical protein N2C12_00800, partial [Planctomycetales bacterium]
MPETPEEKKIIIDEDWKSQVQSEKAATESARPEPEIEAGEIQNAEDTPVENATPESAAEMPLPPADFTTIIGMLATQVMMNLGALP